MTKKTKWLFFGTLCKLVTVSDDRHSVTCDYFKPNSITLSGRRQVRSWSQTCSEQKFGLSSSTS